MVWLLVLESFVALALAVNQLVRGYAGGAFVLAAFAFVPLIIIDQYYFPVY